MAGCRARPEKAREPSSVTVAAVGDADIERVVRAMTHEKRCVVHWDGALRATGEQVPGVPLDWPMPFTGHFVFVDLAPEANWGHPALYLAVSPDGGRVESVAREFPPFAGDYPPSFRTFRIDGPPAGSGH
jgi:hypothetical protein